MEEIAMILPFISQLVTGVGQWWDSSKTSKAAGERPVMTMPTQQTQATSIADRQANNEMPGYQSALKNIQQTGANNYSNATNVATSGNDVLGFMAGTQPGQNASLNQLADQSAQFKNAGAQNLQGALGTEAQYNMAIQADQLAKWEGLNSQAESEKGSGISNIFGAVSGGAKNYLGYENQKSQMDMWAASQGLTYDPNTKKYVKSGVGGGNAGSSNPFQFVASSPTANPTGPDSYWGGLESPASGGSFDPNSAWLSGLYSTLG